MKFKLLKYTFLLALCISSCQITESETEEYIERFYENKNQFDELAKRINSDKYAFSKIGYSINNSELDSIIKQKLNNLEINRTNLSYSNCDKILETEFTTLWTNKATVYFVKNNCDKTQSKKGYHSKSGMIEVWGLGDGWIMWIDYDYI